MYKPMQVNHQGVVQGYFVADRSEKGYIKFLEEEDEDGDLDAKIFSTESEAQIECDILNRPSDNE